MDNKVDDILNKYQHARRDSLIVILQEIQEKFGYLPEESMTHVARQLNLATSKVYGVATFYNQFKFQQKGKIHIRVCTGTSCHISNGSAVLAEFEKQLKIKSGETTRNGRFSLHGVSCMGGCGKGPVVEINGHYFTEVRTAQVHELIDYCNDLEIN